MPNGHAESPSSERSLDLSRMHALASMCLAEGGSPNMTRSHVNTEREQGNLPRLNSLEWEKQVSVVKGRLRKAIQDKRAMNGKDALCLDFILDSPMEDKSLAPEELVHIQRRAHIRKERNRLAAQRMRERRKSYCDKLVKELEVLEDSNSHLVWEIRNLEIEKNKLTTILKTHLQTCDKVERETNPRSEESIVETTQPLDLRTSHSQSPKPEVKNLQLYQAPAPPEVTEQDAPLDLRVLKRHCSVIESTAGPQSRRARLSSV